jgi:DNA polymerase (family X)
VIATGPTLHHKHDVEPAEIGASLREIGEYLALEGDLHRARAYRRAAASVELAPDIERLIGEDRLTTLPRVGDALAGVIGELARRGTVGILERLRARWPTSALELSRLHGIGPVKARRLEEALHPASLDEVAELCERGIVRALPGFGKVSEARILEAIRSRDSKRTLLLLPEARELGAALASYLLASPGVRRAVPCGPTRRWSEVVDRIALAVETSVDGTGAEQRVQDRLERHPLVVATRVEHGLFLARLSNGIDCELHVAPARRFGVAMIVATGSEQHVAGLRALAGQLGMRLDEIEGLDEADTYARLGLPMFPPEVRDGTDEIAAGLDGDPFDLVSLGDVTGAVHCHTLYSDGRNSVAEMAAAARARGHRFLTVTDHSSSASYANGLDFARLQAQWGEIEAAEQAAGIRVLRGTECDILADGSFDYSDDVLGQLDVVIASIHRRHRLGEDGMTQRLVTALRHPCFKIWGHPFGRMLLRRDPVACRFDDVLDAIEDSAVAIELNGDPHRLDMDPTRARVAARRGARFVLSSDAHSTTGLGNIEYAVAMARRARLRRSDVLNTLETGEFAEIVRPGPRAAANR